MGDGSLAPRREERAPMELTSHSASWAGHDHSPGIDIGCEGLYASIQHKGTLGRHPPEYDPVRHRTTRVTTSPQRPAHDTTSTALGLGRPPSRTGTAPLGGSGPRQRGQSHHRRGSTSR